MQLTSLCLSIGGVNENKEFLELLRIKDHNALEVVVRQHTEHLYKACLGMGFSISESEDLTQSVWMTFFDIIHVFEGRSTIRTFLFGILYNKASELRKQLKKADATENIESVLDAHFDENGHWILNHSPVSPDKFFENTQTLSIIGKCLDYLPINQRMAFVLKEIEEEITEEICRVLEITATHLGVLLFRAKNQLRECIDQKSR